MSSTPPSRVVIENGSMLGAMGQEVSSSRPLLWLKDSPVPEVLPKIIISSCQSSSNLHSVNDINIRELRSSQETRTPKHNASKEDVHAENEMLLDGRQQGPDSECELEQFFPNRTTSQTYILESSAYCVSPNTTPLTLDLFNSSCSRADSESRPEKRLHRKSLKSGTKCSSTSVLIPARSLLSSENVFPPHYTAIFLDNCLHPNESSESVSGQALTGNAGTSADPTRYIQYHQYCRSRPPLESVGFRSAHQSQSHIVSHAPRTLLDVAVPLTSNNADAGNYMARASIHLPVVSVSSSNLTRRHGTQKCFGRPSLPFVIGIFALGGVACTLGGIVLGSTGLIEHSTQYISAALLMIGIGVSLLVISGAIWRLSLPDDIDDCPCSRRLETCRNCSGPYCHNRVVPSSYLYPEFLNRPPPPSYLTSLNEYALFYHHSTHPVAAAASHTCMELNTPPPLYRSTYSLNTSATSGPSAGFSFSHTIDIPSDDGQTASCHIENVSQI
ncbi:uncharacterized protein LOC108086367 isoform X2 [Drosophila ficusphila]|uniref:uncharacterized protein LOC108086367 isoform X2 n=1 Tax=Drosophila ficusphila TaxID=30025 RepID=UPI0007E8A88B|nr:uncharacterized protein LOC108086367 isoform X2 [Drosophila ficusphila]